MRGVEGEDVRCRAATGLRRERSRCLGRGKAVLRRARGAAPGCMAGAVVVGCAICERVGGGARGGVGQGARFGLVAGYVVGLGGCGGVVLWWGGRPQKLARSTTVMPASLYRSHGLS